MQLLRKNRKKAVLYLIDLSVMTLSYLFAFLMSYIGDTPDLWVGDIPRYLINFAIFAVCISAAKFLIGVYSNVWRYVSCRAYLEMVFSDAVGGTIALLITLIFRSAYIGVWRSIAVITTYCLVTLLSRFIYQEKHRIVSTNKVRAEGDKTKIAIIGAGTIGSLLAEELLCFAGSKYLPLFFIDNDERKAGNKVAGLPVYAECCDTLSRIKDSGITELIIAIPKLTPERAQEIFDYYNEVGCKIKVYDFPTNQENPDDAKRVIREFKIEDLLFRNQIKLINDETKEYYAGKTVLVTGGGGSIGSELCRQIARCKPKKLIIFDIYENNAYDIQQELTRKYGNELDLAVEIGSVRERARLDTLFAYYRPEIVFHAAAHKHVPLMEHSNCEAIKNNVFGTYNTADMAEKYGVRKFILVSTDKAVNPTNVMGASKRMCEMVIRCRNDSETAFCAVRFGNVLGSNGSVIPLFNKQISSGGPVTITDKRIVRYFMTIPEASGLVMTAGAMAKRGELFVLDMGKPVKIYDLAVNMIKFSGLTPGIDIKIEEIGLRPGEKLYEELLVKKDNMQKTENNLIFIENEPPLLREEVEEKLELLRRAVKENEGLIAAPGVTEALKLAVPTFHTPEEVNKKAAEAEEMKNVVTV